jgi:hypothetical protein
MAAMQVREPKKLEVATPADKIVKTVQVDLPLDFKGSRPSEQYRYLVFQSKLLPEEAADLVAHLSGQKVSTKFEITYFENVLPVSDNPVLSYIEERDKRQKELADKAASQIRQPKVKKEFSVPTSLEARTIFVSIPGEFGSWSHRGQYLYLTGEKKLSPGDAEDVIAVFNGKSTITTHTSVVFQTEKTEDGVGFPASDYAYVPDPESPSTWKLRLTSTPGGEPDPNIVGAAIAALGKGFRGNKVEIPKEDLPKVKDKVLSAWKKAHPDYKEEEIPEVLK